MQELKTYKLYGNTYRLTEYERKQVILYHQKVNKQVKNEGLTSFEKSALGTPICTREDVKKRQQKQVNNLVVEYINNIVSEHTQTKYFYSDNNKEQKEREEMQERVINAKNNILLALNQNNPFSYFQWLIVWDIINANYDQILISLNKSRITKQDIQKAIDYINNFSLELISEYWRETLLSA